MSDNIIAGAIGTALVSAFLLYYAVSVYSVSLAIVMMAVVVLAGRSLYDEVTQVRKQRRSRGPAPPIT